MTAQQIYIMASAFLYEKDGDDAESKQFAIPFLNVLLQESLNTENSIRRYKGTTEITEAPLIASLTDNIDYDDNITRIALPYGLAARFYAEALDTDSSDKFRAEYRKALQEASKLTVSTIDDVYSGVE